MKTIHPIVKVPDQPRVQVEPELAFVIDDYTAAERLEFALKLERWAKQIRLQLTVCLQGDGDYMPPRNVKVIPEPRRKAAIRNN